MQTINLSNLSKKYNISESSIKHIYTEYLKLIKHKASERCKQLLEEEDKTKNDMYYNRGDYCFYLRYLGKYFINHKAYQKWKSTILKK